MRLSHLFRSPSGTKNLVPSPGGADLGGTGLSFERVGFARDGRQIFEDLSLELRDRRIGLIGDNGSGKSTLLRLAKGLLEPSRGRVVVGGGRGEFSRPEMPGAVGFIFQNPDHQLLFPTVGEEVAFGLQEQGLEPKEARAKAVELLAEHGCGGWEDRAVHELSEGEKQLVCVLAILAPEPRTLLLDEPFSSLDLPTKLAFSARLAQLSLQIIMASHDLDLLSGFDRVVWLDHGRVRMDGPPAAVLPRYRAHAHARAVTEGTAAA